MPGITDVLDISKRIFELIKGGAKIGSTEEILALREAAADVRDELLTLREENRELREREQKRREWAALAQPYTMVQTPGGAFVYSSDGPPPHHACPACFQNQSIQFLQPDAGTGGTFTCQECETNFRLLRPDRPRNLYARE